MKNTVWVTTLIIMFMGLVNTASAAVSVSPSVSFYNPVISAVINAGQHHIEPLYTLKKDMDVKIEGNISGIFTDIVPLICDEENLQKFIQKQSYSCWGGKREYSQFSLSEKTYSDTPHYLVLYNPFDLLKPLNTKSVQARAQIKYTLSTEDRQDLENQLNSFYQGVSGLFDVPEFHIKFMPCDARNAYSDSLDGDITICSEILGEAHLKEKGGIFGGVLFHELGHTVLNLWGLPGWNNERTADEFATVILIISGRGKTDKAQEWIEFFDPSKKNVIYQAQSIAQSGGPHPLDVQRIEAIQQIIDNPLPVIRRWNNILYPRMKTEILQEIVAGRFDIYGRDTELAQKILKERVN